MNTQPQPIIRYTRRCHQAIEWQGNGVYSWLPDRCVWRKMATAEVEVWIKDPSGREETFGLTKGFTENATLVQMLHPDTKEAVAWDGSGTYRFEEVQQVWLKDDEKHYTPGCNCQAKRHTFLINPIQP